MAIREGIEGAIHVKAPIDETQRRPPPVLALARHNLSGIGFIL